jgi:alkaline phosphatase D
MHKNYFFLAFFLLLSYIVNAQERSGLVSGPWAGNVELRNAVIWAEVGADVKNVAVRYSRGTDPTTNRTVLYKGELGKAFNPVKIALNGLDLNTTYNYVLLLNGKPATTVFKTQFTTKELWQYRKPAPDFNFLAGSCAYFNEPAYDRPGKPYGMDSSIFVTMANTPAVLNVWLGDGWYTREVDFLTPWGLNYRVSRDRSMKVVQKFMAAMPQYYIWDDHDYGPNNAGKSYLFKTESRQVFKDYTLNPSYGEEGKGIYTKISYGDVDIFLTDDRFFRSEANFPDSVNGRPNPAKTYFGATQLDWLKNALLYSNATFKIIATGSQVLNPLSGSECMRFYSYEYNDLLQFLSASKISGVLFLTGDRHHSEVVKEPRPGSYPLYDITISPLTATVSKVRGNEINNPARISGTLVEAQNFGNISVTGKKNERTLKVSFTGIDGAKLAEWSISEQELKEID